MTSATIDDTRRRTWLLARPEDLHCVLYHLAVVAAYAVAFWLWLHPEVSGLDTLLEKLVFVGAAAPLLGWISGIDVGVNFHNHTHRRIFKSKLLSRWFARFWTPVGGWPCQWWAYLHVDVHHVHLLGEPDWTVPIKDANGNHEPSMSYQLKHWPWRTAWHFAKDIRYGRFDKRRAFGDLFWFALIYSIPFWIDWQMALALWVVPHWFANCMTLNRGMWVQHAGCGAYPANPKAQHSNDFLTPFFNRTMFNIGFHGEHHDFPGMHWADLPDLHRRLEARKHKEQALNDAAAAPAAAPPAQTS
ncbi:MAG: fatty acid desaturase [Planctomycetes bacterium]|nr:fatty acid desaturase [Planctomycetota bacterium]